MPRVKTRPKPPTRDAAAAHRVLTDGRPAPSTHARSIAFDLLEAPKELRRSYLHTLTDRDREYVFTEVERELGTLYGLWHDTPTGFIEDVLGETQWGLQAQVTDSIALPGVTRTIVPAGFGVGKTFLAGRMVAWAGAVNPVGTITIVTTATRWRQVRNQLWPHIRTAVAKGAIHGGATDTTQWVGMTRLGTRHDIAYGFSAPANDEAAMQGIHGTPKLLLVVDEAGGIDPLIGRGTNNLLTGDAKLLAIGNPAMNEVGSWLEGASLKGEDPEEPETVTIRISTLDSPAITGAPTPICRACVPNLDGHTIAEGVNGKSHLPDWQWLRETCGEYGVIIDRDERDIEKVRKLITESGQPYLISKVLAQFPKDAGNQVIPTSWVEAATDYEVGDGRLVRGADYEIPDDVLGDYVRLPTLGLPGETEDLLVQRGAWIRLGVDVAADGGDEFAIYRSIGDLIHHRHASAGPANADAMVVSEKIIEEINAARALAQAIGSPHRIRVKIDANGLGWGVVGILRRAAETGRITADIVAVMVSESPFKDDPAAAMRPYRKRDEMWLALRALLQPDPTSGRGRLRLRLDQKAKAQLSQPRLGNNASGYSLVESKKEMKRRGIHSPDRAEAALLAIYEPEPVNQPKRLGLLGGSR